jgi:hypothetical protein
MDQVLCQRFLASGTACQQTGYAPFAENGFGTKFRTFEISTPATWQDKELN